MSVFGAAIHEHEHVHQVALYSKWYADRLAI